MHQIAPFSKKNLREHASEPPPPLVIRSRHANINSEKKIAPPPTKSCLLREEIKMLKSSLTQYIVYKVLALTYSM